MSWGDGIGREGVVHTLDDPTRRGAPIAGSPASAYEPTFSPRRRRRRAPFVWSGIGALVVASAVAAGLVHLDAGRSFDAALERSDVAAAAHSAATADAAAAVEDGADAAEAATAIVAAVTDPLVGAKVRSRVADAGATLATAVDAAQQVLEAEAPDLLEDRPLWTWELYAAIPGLDADADALATRAAELGSAAAAVDDAVGTLAERTQAMFATVPASAAAVEAANVSARATAVLDFRDAAAFAAAQDRAGTGAVIAAERYAAAAETLRVSAKSERAEKAGPLFDTRLEIEAYARSIAGGVVLDFDWAPLVNGLGGADGMSGTATWNTMRGGFSTITLSDSVAENWPSADAMALVTHEVGHSITAKCSDLFDSADDDANEQWATAWAISMGHTAEGNGVQAYGYPSQEMIDVAATCR